MTASGAARHATHRPLPYPLLPVLRASNGAGLIHPDDRKYGALLVGGQGSGKTAAMLRIYLNDMRDDNAAVVVLDPKSELSRLCLRLTPPDTARSASGSSTSATRCSA